MSRRARGLGPLRLTREAVKRYFDIHSAIGVIGGLVFFVCSFSGALALFERELIAWERPAVRYVAPSAGAEMLGADALLARAHAHLGDERDLFVTLPTPMNGGFLARAFGGDRGRDEVMLHPYTGALLPNDHDQARAFAFLTHLHTDLHLPRPFGRYLVGLIGVFMMMALISGVMAHPQALRNVFLMRWRPRLRLTLSDLHKQLGVWGLVFGWVMAATGAVIGLLGIFAPIMVLSAFDGDVGKATEAFSGPHAEKTGVHAAMLPVSSLIETLEQRVPDTEVRSFLISHWGDETAEVALNLTPTPYRAMVAGETHRVSLVDGSTIHVSTFTTRGAGTRLFGTVQPLHYGLFGGRALKLVYFVSGILLSLMIATGSLIWLERRRAQQPVDARDRYRGLERLHVGVTVGIVLASAVAIAVGRFASAYTEPAFWLAWLGVIAVAYGMRDVYALMRIGGWLTGGVLCATAAGDLLLSSVQTPATIQVSWVVLVIGFVILGLSAIRPSGRARSAAAPLRTAAASPPP
ncbi:MAG: PepSY-associated TM helix domain-containing protein [Acidobacteriota bacterium]